MKLINSECITGFNKIPYFIRTSGTGNDKKISVDWFSKKTGIEESVEVFRNDSRQDIEVVLETIRKAIRHE